MPSANFDNVYCDYDKGYQDNDKSKKVFICSPLRGDFENNRRIAECMCRFATLLGYEPRAPHVYFTRFLSDDNEEEREKGIQYGLDWLKECSEIWVIMPNSELTEGMTTEIAHAKKLGIEIKHFDFGENK